MTDELEGKKIVAVRQMTAKELEHEGWDNPNTCLVLDDGSLLYPSQDEEGNGPGAIFGFSKGQSFMIWAQEE